ncbi:hypothetical protein P175DRAFT_0401639, partial [Aspergillus ochraceoroseus IBT 24754]
RSLLLTLDAFGTLFHPRAPIATQYAASATSFNLPPISPERLHVAFKTAFKAQSSSYPNYGREQVLRGEYAGPRQWWEEVIRGSFSRALSDLPATSLDMNANTKTEDHNKNNPNPTANTGACGVHIPDALIQDLLDRFASARGYALYADVRPFFDMVRSLKQQQHRRILIGVVSNSDDRISAVLESLGVSVSLPGFEEDRESQLSPLPKEENPGHLRLHDIDFVVTSYQAGAEKPERLIYEVAQRQAQCESGSEWEWVHVGDDYRKDYLGALEAGGEAYFLPRDNTAGKAAGDNVKTITSLLDLIPEL